MFLKLLSNPYMKFLNNFWKLDYDIFENEIKIFLKVTVQSIYEIIIFK